MSKNGSLAASRIKMGWQEVKLMGSYNWLTVKTGVKINETFGNTRGFKNIKSLNPPLPRRKFLL